MTQKQMYTLLYNTDSHLGGRSKALSLLQCEQNGFEYLFQHTFLEGDAIQSISSYILDDYYSLEQNLIVPYLDVFITRISLVKNESVKRIISKMLICIVNKQFELLTTKHKQMIVSSCLSWLIDNSKVATEANAMELLIRLRKEFPNEFSMGAEIIEINYYARSVAYQNKGKKYLMVLREQS